MNRGRCDSGTKGWPSGSAGERRTGFSGRADEIATDYEKNTGVVICQCFRQLDPDAVPAVLVAGHGPFCWGTTAAAAAHHAVILESVARMAYFTLNLGRESLPIGRALHDKHFLRKHGQDAYYGQVKTK